MNVPESLLEIVCGDAVGIIGRRLESDWEVAECDVEQVLPTISFDVSAIGRVYLNVGRYIELDQDDSSDREEQHQVARILFALDELDVRVDKVGSHLFER